MTNSKDLFLDKEIRLGGFYELAIQVCSSVENDPIKKYTDFIWTLDNVQGPFDDNYNKIKTDIEIFSNNGLIKIDNFELPFLTYNVRETEPIETGFNWFDICFYTAAIEKVFGSEYQTWVEKPKSPKQLDYFFLTTVKKLFEIYPFKLAILGYEVSGQYYFDNLMQEFEYDSTPTKFFIGQKNLELVAAKNRNLITIID